MCAAACNGDGGCKKICRRCAICLCNPSLNGVCKCCDWQRNAAWTTTNFNDCFIVLHIMYTTLVPNINSVRSTEMRSIICWIHFLLDETIDGALCYFSMLLLWLSSVRRRWVQSAKILQRRATLLVYRIITIYTYPVRPQPFLCQTPGSSEN